MVVLRRVVRRERILVRPDREKRGRYKYRVYLECGHTEAVTKYQYDHEKRFSRVICNRCTVESRHVRKEDDQA